MTLKRIHLELARDHDFPKGSREHGYDFIAPLDTQGRLIAAEWSKNRARCGVRRFWKGQPDEIGQLVHKRGGAWVFDYNQSSDDDDEPGFKFDKHRFIPGEYVSIAEHDGAQRTFSIKTAIEFD